MIREFELEFEELQIHVTEIVDHDKVYGRDKPDQHPIESISGLREELDRTLKSSPSDKPLVANNFLTVNENNQLVDSGICCDDVVTSQKVEDVVTEKVDTTVTTIVSEKVEELVEDKLQEVSADKTFTHSQSTASDLWVINHNLNKMPSVTIVDSGGNVVIGEVTYVDMNNLTLKFNGAFSGKAYIN